MSKVLVTESYLEDIADAIREKTGSSASFKPSEMGGGIRGISTAESLIICSACGSNATVTATLGSVSRSVTANSSGVANIFVGGIGTYTVSSTGSSQVKTITISAMHTIYEMTLSSGELIINEALFYTDFNNRYSNLNAYSDYYLTTAQTPSYTAGIRGTLNTQAIKLYFSTPFENVVKTSNSDMTIIAVMKVTSLFTSDKGSRIFDFYNTSNTRTQGTTIYGTSVRGMDTDQATAIATIAANDWFVMAIRKKAGTAEKNVSVYYEGTFTALDCADQSTYGIVRLFSTESYALTYGNIAGLVLLNRYIEDDEMIDASVYLIDSVTN